MTQSSVATGELAVSSFKLHMRQAGSGPPLLYLHDELSSAWSPFLDLLSERFHVYAPDLPGFGESVRPDWIESIDDAAFLLADVADALAEDGRISVAGASLGGWLALEMALRAGPVVSRVAVAGCPGIAIANDPPADYFILTPEERTALFFNDPSKAPVVDEDHMIRNEQMTARLVWQPRYVSPKLGARLHRLRAPVLVAWGRDDRFLSRAHGEVLVEGLPNAELTIVSGSGHFPAIEQPQALADSFTNFLVES